MVSNDAFRYRHLTETFRQISIIVSRVVGPIELCEPCYVENIVCFPGRNHSRHTQKKNLFLALFINYRPTARQTR